MTRDTDTAFTDKGGETNATSCCGRSLYFIFIQLYHMNFSLMVAGWSRRGMKPRQPRSRGAGENRDQMRPPRSSPGRSRSTTTTDDSQDHHSAMDLVRNPNFIFLTFISNFLTFAVSWINCVLIIITAAALWCLFITVLPSVFKPVRRKRREEARGAEEVHEDENTVTELPVDQVQSSYCTYNWIVWRYVTEGSKWIPDKCLEQS